MSLGYCVKSPLTHVIVAVLLPNAANTIENVCLNLCEKGSLVQMVVAVCYQVQRIPFNVCLKSGLTGFSIHLVVVVTYC